ncbi:MAG: hypothetical protein WBC73_08545 [Phormidesmis sp.]
METAQIRDQIQTYVDRLSAERLKVVLDFLSYLADREEDEATRELLAIPNFKRDLEKAENQADSGELVDWRTVRDDVWT